MSLTVRNFINIINEAIKPTKTGDKTGFDLIPSLEPKAMTVGSGKRNVAGLPGKKATGKHRFKAIDLGPEVGAQAARHFDALNNVPGLEDTMSDDEARRNAGMDDADFDAIDAPTDVPAIAGPAPTTENLPAIIRQEIAQTGGKIFPEWHQIKDLPRYIQSPIRALGRAVFGQFTDTPIEDIQMISTIAGNPERDVVGMMDWIRRNGVRNDAAKIDFSRIMPGYEAETSLWRTADYSFLLVRDFGGYYIYAWAQKNGIHLGHHDPKMIESAKRKTLEDYMYGMSPVDALRGTWIDSHPGTRGHKDREGIYLIMPGSNTSYGPFASEEEAETFNTNHLHGRFVVKNNNLTEAKSTSKQEYRFSKTGKSSRTCHAHGVKDAIKQFRAMKLYSDDTPDKYYRERIMINKNGVWEHV